MVKKIDTTSCVFRASMQEPTAATSVKIRDIMGELSSLFTDAIEQVNVSTYSLISTPSCILRLINKHFVFKVKEQCDFRTPLEDKIRVMVRSTALKAPRDSFLQFR